MSPYNYPIKTGLAGGLSLAAVGPASSPSAGAVITSTPPRDRRAR
jgi:hypothetical protein